VLSGFCCFTDGGLGGADEGIRTYHARRRRLVCNIYRGQGPADEMPTHHCRRASPLSRPPRRGRRAMVLPHSPARVWDRQSTTASEWAVQTPMCNGTAMNPRVPPTGAEAAAIKIRRTSREPMPLHTLAASRQPVPSFGSAAGRAASVQRRPAVLPLLPPPPPALCVEWTQGNQLSANADEA
jgi:hypothetical protein